MAYVAFEVEPAVMLADDAVDDGEAKAGAFADLFGGEEGFEDFILDFFGDAATGIADGEMKMETGAAGFGVSGLLDVSSAEAKGECAALRHHGIAGVDAEIHDDLFDHVFVGVDGGEVIFFTELDADLFAKEGMEEVDEAEDDGAERKGFELGDLAAAVGEELAGEGGGALSGGNDFVGLLAMLRVERGVVFKHLGIALDDGEEVIEIVGDAAGQLPDGFGFLGLADVGFELETLGDVDAVGVDDAMLADKGEVPLKGVLGEGVLDGGLRRRAVKEGADDLWVLRGEEVARIGEAQRLGSLRSGGIGVEDFSVLVDFKEGIGVVLSKGGKAGEGGGIVLAGSDVGDVDAEKVFGRVGVKF